MTSGPQMFDARGVHRETLSATVTPTLTRYERPMLVRPQLRYLTPVELERLQGFPDRWTEWGLDARGRRIALKDSPRCRQLGNAVAVPVAEWIARRIVQSLRSGSDGSHSASTGQPESRPRAAWPDHAESGPQQSGR